MLNMMSNQLTTLMFFTPLGLLIWKLLVVLKSCAYEYRYEP